MNRRVLTTIGLAIIVVAFVISMVSRESGLAEGFYVTFGAFLTLSILSFLYKDNPFYKFAEHLFVGVSAAYWMSIGFWTTLIPNLIGRIHPPLVKPFLPQVADAEPVYWYIIPALLGIILLLRLSSKVGWISRWSLAFIVGTTAGLNFVRYLRSDFLGQIYNTINPLVVRTAGSFNSIESISAVVTFLGVFCGIVYFYFSSRHLRADDYLWRRVRVYGDGAYFPVGRPDAVPLRRLAGDDKLGRISNQLNMRGPDMCPETRE